MLKLIVYCAVIISYVYCQNGEGNLNLDYSTNANDYIYERVGEDYPQNGNPSLVLGNEDYSYGYTNYQYNGVSGSGDDETAAVGTYLVAFRAKFKPQLKNEDSRRFEKLSQEVDRQVTSYLSEELVLVEDDVVVQVLAFEAVGKKKHTRATVSVEITHLASKTSAELTDAMLRFSDRGRINGKKVFEVTEVAIPTGTEVPNVGANEDTSSAPVDYDVVITYEKRFQKVLRDDTSSAFQKEKSAVEEELSLFLTASGEISQSNLVNVNVREFESRSRRSTAAIMTITLTDTPIDRLNAALQGLVGGTLYESVIRSAEIVTQVEPTESSTLEPTRSTEPTPPEPTPPSRGDEEPEIVASVRPTESSTLEPTRSTEPTPPKPTLSSRGDEEPEELPDHCQLIDDPEDGLVTCSNSNEILSTCTFTCGPDFSLKGPNSITCEESGLWSGGIPYCQIIICSPDLLHDDFPHGVVECSNNNLLGSDCNYRCNRGYEVVGDINRVCQDNGTWSGSKPTCELVPVDCVIEYKPWSECENQVRRRESRIVQEAVGTGNPCPSPLPYIEEACVDCRIAWNEWGDCSNGYRERWEVVLEEPVGVGEPCPELQAERENCSDCVLRWGGWGECADGKRQRTEVVAEPKVGAGQECPSPRNEVEDCIDCQIGWDNWGECTQNDNKFRYQVILQPPVGVGKPCPALRRETDVCLNCQIDWGDWEECADGKRTRRQVILVLPFNGGNECPPLQIESEDCFDCEVAWGNWTECSNDERIISQFVVTPQVGAGRPCPQLLTRKEACIDCKVAWGNWSECSNDERIRSQYVVTPQVGAGRPCPELEILREDCNDCVWEWGPWSDCVEFESFREMRVIREPVGEAAKPCPRMERETQDCRDCELVWDEWSDCEDGIQIRSQIILIEPQGSGKKCTFKPLQEQVCANCEIAWGNWSECIEGLKVRRQYVKVERVGSGASCPSLDIERDSCGRDCVVDWRPWSECRDGIRSREQYVVTGASDGSVCELQAETEICIDCQLAWADWSSCINGSRVRYQYINVLPLGAGAECPPIGRESEACIHCVVKWEEWGPCEDGKRSRSQFIAVRPVGAGDPCGLLVTENEVCIDCVMKWGEYGECLNGESKRKEYIATPASGAGVPCPSPQTQIQACANCEVEWEKWSECEDGRKNRSQKIKTQPLGNGTPCPSLETEAETCGIPDNEDVLCRYTREFLGYGGNRNRRDILLLGDESGSIGWINYEKIKKHFEAVARQIRGGVGPDHAQLAMMSFAKWTRTQFGFDTYDNAADVIAAISKAKYHGGSRSKIGQALVAANAWMFQQAEGMRGFPGYDDDITHEILIATDGCRTSSNYYLLKGLRKIQKRGIKLSVLGIESRDPRCREALRELRSDEIDLYEVGDWESLVEFNIKIERRVCQP